MTSSPEQQVQFNNYKIPLCLLAIYLRLCISFAPHSGQATPPKYGDYEAQRHWQEITVNLPSSDWYRNTTDNDLAYWGLDYPPLTAYHSLALGKVAQVVNGSWVKLHHSRGEESYGHKVFMRWSVVVSEFLYLGPLFLLSSSHPTALILIAITPAQPLIDHGHFQYNCISLGLTLCAVYALHKTRYCLGSAFFSLALNYKQMSLYHALPFFFYLLGPRYKSWNGIWEVVKIGVTVVLTFLLCWAPLLPTAGDVVLRMFPFNRGLFEDKVANFWCSVSVVLKIKDLFSRFVLAKMSLFLTVFTVLPSQLLLFRHPTHKSFILALTNSALGFFLFSFHVHEKTILIPLTTVMLLFQESREPALWFTAIATFSMWPLLYRDGLAVVYLASMGLLLTVTHVVHRMRWWFWVSMLGCLVLHGLEVLVPAPDRYPHIHPLLNSLYSAGHFGLFFCYFNYLQVSNQ